MVVHTNISNVDVEVHIDYCPKEGSIASNSEHYYAGHFKVEKITLFGADITELLGDSRVEEIEKQLEKKHNEGCL